MLGCLIRIQHVLSKKRYLKSKQTYEYERMFLYIPKKHHQTVKPFLGRGLEVDVKTMNDALIVTLSVVKTFRHAENTPQETCSRDVSGAKVQRSGSDSV